MSASKRRPREELILLLLGVYPETKLPRINIGYMLFILSKFHPKVSALFSFRPSIYGPLSFNDYEDSVLHPKVCNGCWVCEPKCRVEGDGPYVNEVIYTAEHNEVVAITEKGIEEYRKVYEKYIKRPRSEGYGSLLTGIVITRLLYDDLTPDQFLLLIWDTYPSYVINDFMTDEIYRTRNELVDGMVSKGMINEDRAKELKEMSYKHD